MELSKSISQLKEENINFLMTNSNTEKTKEIFLIKNYFVMSLK